MRYCGCDLFFRGKFPQLPNYVLHRVYFGNYNQLKGKWCRPSCLRHNLISPWERVWCMRNLFWNVIHIPWHTFPMWKCTDRRLQTNNFEEGTEVSRPCYEFGHNLYFTIRCITNQSKVEKWIKMRVPVASDVRKAKLWEERHLPKK